MPRQTREEIMAERVAAGLHPKAGSQSLAESRRILMTWDKAHLIDFYLREESDALKATDRAITAEMALREHRAESFTMPKPMKGRVIADPVRKEAYERWLHPHKGQSVDAEQVFNAGYMAGQSQVASTGEPEQ